MLSNLHIVMNDCVHASRVLKETQSIAKLLPGDGELIVVAANRSRLLPEIERLDDKRTIRRIAIAVPRFLSGKAATVFRFPLWMISVLFRYIPKKPRVVNIHHAETMILGVLFKLLAGSKFVYDPHELEPEKSGYGPLKRKVVAFMEKLFIPFSDEMFVVNKSISDEYVQRYGCKPPTVLMNVPRFVELPPKNRRLHDALGIDYKKKICLYLGSLAPGRGIEFILDSFEASADPDFVAVFVGFGQLQKEIERRATACPRIYFHSAVQPAEVLSLAASADVGLCILEAISLNNYYALPNKFFEYLFAGLPVVVPPFPELARLVNDYGVGVVMQDRNSEALIDSVKAAGALGEGTMQQKIDKVRKDYSWDAQEHVVDNVYGKYFSVGNS